MLNKVYLVVMSNKEIYLIIINKWRTIKKNGNVNLLLLLNLINSYNNANSNNLSLFCRFKFILYNI